MPIMTLGELLTKLRDAQQKMSRKNPHRLLLMQCEDALIQLAGRAGEHTQETANAPSPAEPVGRIVITG